MIYLHTIKDERKPQSAKIFSVLLSFRTQPVTASEVKLTGLSESSFFALAHGHNIHKESI